jgi:hypothetical protein
MMSLRGRAMSKNNSNIHDQKVDIVHVLLHSQNQVSTGTDWGQPSIRSMIVNDKPSPEFQQMGSKVQHYKSA